MEVTTINTIKVKIDRSYGLKERSLFTAVVITDTMNSAIIMEDRVIVERDYVQYISEDVGYVPSHGIYAVIRDGNIIPLSGHVYVRADKDKNNTITSNGVSLEFPKHFKEFQTDITTHDGVIEASSLHYFNKGDKVYCHHHLTHPSNERVIDGETYYQIQTDQVYCKVSDKIQMYNGWNLVEPITVDNTGKMLEARFDDAKSSTYGTLIHKDIDAEGLVEGSQVAFLPDMDYEMIVEGKRYYRIRTKDLAACVAEETK